MAQGRTGDVRRQRACVFRKTVTFQTGVEIQKHEDVFRSAAQGESKPKGQVPGRLGKVKRGRGLGSHRSLDTPRSLGPGSATRSAGAGVCE